jgi:hypothetical protein
VGVGAAGEWAGVSRVCFGPILMSFWSGGQMSG